MGPSQAWSSVRSPHPECSWQGVPGTGTCLRGRRPAPGALRRGPPEGGQMGPKPLAGADASSLGGARGRARPRYEATWPRQPQTDQQPNYTNTDLNGGKIYISCENRQTADRPLSFLLARLLSQQVADGLFTATLGSPCWNPKCPPAPWQCDPRGGRAAGKGAQSTLDSLSPPEEGRWVCAQPWFSLLLKK